LHRNAHAVEIDRPATEIFPYMVASEHRLRWMGALVESTPLTEGAPRVGSRWHDVFEDHGQRIELEAELIRFEPSRMLELRLAASAFESTSMQTLEETDGRTRVTIVLETEYKARIARLFAGAVTRHAQNRLESDLAALKKLVEGLLAPVARTSARWTSHAARRLGR
jgi:uncharacterized protein YndB with AHSA1/START domain